MFFRAENRAELVIAVVIFGVGLAVLAGQGGMTRSASGVRRLAPSWIKQVLFADHTMWVAVGFFAIALVVLTKVFGP